MLLFAFRETRSNVARAGYAAIHEYTSMRRTEISTAVQILQGAQLCRLALHEEVSLRGGQHKHNRYLICGLAGQNT